MPDPINLNDPAELAKINPQIANIVVGGNKKFAKTENPYAPATPHSYDPTGAENPNQNFERYYTHSSYDKLNFNPWRDNESLYNEQGSASGDIWRATKAGAKLTWTGFMSPLRSYADVFTGDALTGDQQSAQEMKYLNAIGSSTRKGAAGFTSNLITNSGYTIGLIGEMALEVPLLAAAITASGGVATPGVLARLGKYGKDFGKYAKWVEGLTKAVQSLNNYSAAELFWKGAKGVANFVNPLENTANAYKAVKGVEELTKLAKISTTAGGFFRDIQMANLTLSESKLEGASAENDLKEELIADYRRKNDGKWPPEKELLAINEAAKDAGFKTLAWNIPTIYLTNKITFEPLLKSFSKGSTFTLKNGLEVIDAGKKGIVEATFANRTIAAFKPKNLLQTPFKYFKENLSEGIQESAQEVISGAAKDYYEKIYNNAAKQGMDYAIAENQGDNVWDALSSNVVDQFSGKGFETFASGFLMGALIKPISSGISVIKDFKNKEYKQQKAAYAQATLAKLNEINKNPLTLFGNGILNFSNGAEAVKGQKKSEDEGSQKDWQDFEDQNVMSNVLTALDNGAYGIYQEKLKTIKSMTPEAIKEAYGIDGQEVLSKIDSILARSESIKENYEKWNDRYQNPFDPNKYNKGTTQYTGEAIGYVTWESAKKLAIFNESSFERNVGRIQNITNDILQTEGLNKVGATDISLLFTPQSIESELKLLGNELEVMSESEIVDKAAIKLKRDKFKKLEAFNQKLRGYYLGLAAGAELGKVSKKQLRKSYEDYVTHLANSQTESVPVDRLKLESSFQQLLDIHNLKQDNIQHAEAINIFANPEGFVDQYKRLNKVFSDLYESREELNKKAVENTQAKIEDNAILNVLYERGFVLSPENVEKLLKTKEIPDEFYDQNARQVVNEADPIRFQEFKDIIEKYVEVTKPEENAKPVQTNDLAVENINIIDTKSDDIIAQLNKLKTPQEKLNWLKDNGLITPIIINGKSYNSVDYNDRIMVLVKLGKYNIPFYISTGQAGKKNVKAGNWYAIFGIGESGWINKGSEELINKQYDFPIFQKIAKILNEGVGNFESRENNGNGKIIEGIGYLEDSKIAISEFNAQMGLPITPAKNNTETKVFYENVNIILSLVNDELKNITQTNNSSAKKADIEKRRQEELNKVLKEFDKDIATWEEIKEYTGTNNPGEALDAIYDRADKEGRADRKRVPGQVSFSFTDQEQRLIDYIVDGKGKGAVSLGETIDSWIEDLKNRKEKLYNNRSEKNSAGKINLKYDAELAALSEIKPIPTSENKEPLTITKDAQHLIDTYNKIDKITNEENWKGVENELSIFMAEIHIDDYNASGVTLEAIKAKLDEKLNQLRTEVTIGNLKKGNIVSLAELDQLGRNRYATIKKLGKDYVILEALEMPGFEWRVNEKDLKKEVKFKYSDVMRTDKIVQPTADELAKVKQNSEKVIKFTDNAETLKAILDEAYADEAKFEQDFINKLGCK